MRIVYDASARDSNNAPSLNDCLETGPPLQNQLWSVLVRNRFHPVAIAGDLKQAFLQVRIRETDRDVLRFHWLRDLDSQQVRVLRFTRALFGLSPSPFLLAGVIKEHLQRCKSTYPQNVIEEIDRSMYVDDLISGGDSVDSAAELKRTAIQVFGEAKFELHKWHSNVETLEQETANALSAEQSYTKQQLGVNEGETKLLGLSWDKREDTLYINPPTQPAETTKRGVLGKIAKVYDPLGLVSPITLKGKLIYRDVCDQKLPWDTALSPEVKKRFLLWELSLPQQIGVPRSLAKPGEKIDSIELHAFGDASGKGVSAAVFAVVRQTSSTTQALVTAKARLAKKGLTIPRLELVSGHMSANLVHNVREALEGFPIERVICWLDSTVALHWIKGNGEYKQFVENRVRKIQEKTYIIWRHVGTNDNPADIGSRGGDVSELWMHGPKWLSQPKEWPSDIVTSATQETRAEAKLVKEVLRVAVKEEDKDNYDEILVKHTFWQAIRITAWINRFVQNCRNKKSNRVVGPLTTSETEKQIKWWIKREQQRYSMTDKFQEDQLHLNLQKNEEGIYKCRGRIQGNYPLYLPPRTTLTEKIVQDAHWHTLHGGVGLTMSHVRQIYWIPKLRHLIRRVVKQCYGCKKFHTTAFHSPPPGSLPIDRTEGSTPFQVVGVDYAGPIMYKMTSKKEGKAYILLFTCSLIRAVHIELLPDLTTEMFIVALKQFIARRGRPHKIYSDNGKSFVGAAKWLRNVMRDETAQDYLAHQSIVWQFNLSRAPWWGGQFERLVGIVKKALYKSVGRAVLTWKELEEVMLDVEVAINNRPLTYVEDDVQLPLLTPNLMVYGQPNLIPEMDADSLDDTNLRKREKYLHRCKDVLWSRWTKEYVRSLRERHNLKHNTKELNLKIGDVVLIQSDERNRGKWNIGIVDKLIKGRDGVVRAVKLRAGKSFLERAPQQLYPMELSCDRQPSHPLNPTVREFRPRAAAQAARQRINEIVREENQDI